MVDTINEHLTIMTCMRQVIDKMLCWVFELRAKWIEYKIKGKYHWD